jgi:glycosyltransferase involved in cell wall biosynthesis
MKPVISLIILTKNEAENIRFCLDSVKDLVSEIIVVDSGSTDDTLKIVTEYGARVFTNPFKNQAEQFNWALDNTSPQGDWILRLDADEYLLPELKVEILDTLENTTGEIVGFFLKRRVYFMGRWIRHGGYYPTWILRLFRRGQVRSELREMDEHLVLVDGGQLKYLKNDFVDENHKNLSWWIEKHNQYASREAEAEFMETGEVDSDPLGDPVERKRWWKNNFYGKSPLFLRAFVYFVFRYFVRLGFLDGKPGLIFHTLQGFWYRFLVDVKLYQLRINEHGKN